jgi:hypothetical protein
MWALKVSRSTTAAARRGSVNVWPPFAERRVGRDRNAGAFPTFGEYLEQQLGAAGVQVQVAELIEADQLEAASTSSLTSAAALV